MEKPNRAVFLDRDGVINEALRSSLGKPIAPLVTRDFKLLPGVVGALKKISENNYKIFIVTNQPDLSKGTLTLESLNEMHDLLKKTAPIDEIAYCPHQAEHDCDCRKPKPGMLLHLARKWGIDLKNSYMVGDRFIDISAGKQAGCKKTILIGSGYGEQTEQPNYHAQSLFDALPLFEF